MDALRSMKRYAAHALGDGWEVRLFDEPGTYNRPFAVVEKVGPSLYSGPSHVTDVIQPMSIHAYPDIQENSTVEDAILLADEVEKLLYQAFRVGIEYDDSLMPPPTIVCVGFDEEGTLPAGTYHYHVSAVNASGESLPQERVSAVLTGATSRVELTWTPAAGATSYRLYRALGNGAVKFLEEVTAVTHIDTGAVVPGAGDPPAVGSGTATIRSGPNRVPLYDYDGKPYSGTGASSSVREISDYVRLLDVAIRTLHDATDERLVWVVADIRTSWRQRGRVHSGTEVLKSVTTEINAS